MKLSFNYNKKQVLQALRYHFISIKELRIMIILVNVFALLSLVLYLLGRITPVAFLLYAFLWIMLMISLWFVLPAVVYNRSETFKHAFTMYFNDRDFTLEHAKGKRSWPYSALKTYKETPNFFHLYFDKRSFLLVPKDGIRTIEEMQALRLLLKNNI